MPNTPHSSRRRSPSRSRSMVLPPEAVGEESVIAATSRSVVTALAYVSQNARPSCPASSGASSNPCPTLAIRSIGHGLLDRPVKPGDDSPRNRSRPYSSSSNRFAFDQLAKAVTLALAIAAIGTGGGRRAADLGRSVCLLVVGLGFLEPLQDGALGIVRQ